MAYELAGIPVRASVIGMPALLVAAATPVLLVMYPLLPPNLVWLGYLIPVVLASVRWGFVGAAVASIAAGLAGDFFFTQPYYSLWMDDPRDVVALFVFLLAAVGSAVVITRGRQESRSEAKSTSAVHRLLLDLSDCQTSGDVVTRFGQWISAFARGRVTLIRAEPVDPQLAIVPGEVHRLAVEMCGAKSAGIRSIATAANKRWLLKQLRFEHTIYGVLAVEAETEAHDQGFVEAALTAAAMRFADLAQREALAAAAEHVLDTGFSDQWCTPLTTILGAASVLQMRAETDGNRLEQTLLADIRDEAEHLGRLLRNGLSALRVSVRGAGSRLNWVDPTDLIASTLDQSAPRASAAAIETKIEEDLPFIEINSALFAEGCGQLLSDALRSSPPDSTIKVDVHRAKKDVAISISREPSRKAVDEDGERSPDGQCRVQNSSSRSEIGMWIAASLVQAAGAIINPAARNSPYGPIATLRIPIRRAN